MNPQGCLTVYGEQKPEEELADDFTDSYGNIHLQALLIPYDPAYETKMISPSST